MCMNTELERLNATEGTKRLPDTEMVMRCVSGMKGNFHIPF